MTSQDDGPLFEALDITDQSAWDDSALIRAYELATKTHTVANNDSRRCGKRRRRGPPREPLDTPMVNTQASVGEDVDSKSDSAREMPNIERTECRLRKPHTMLPPPPPALYGMQVPRDVEQLLLAWYEAGYRAGMYAAKMSTHGNHAAGDGHAEKGPREREKVDQHQRGSLK